MLSKVGSILTMKQIQRPHKIRERIPLNLLLRTKLGLTRNETEAKLLLKVKEGNLSIDGKIRRDHKYPVGIMDIVTVNKTGSNYRLTLMLKVDGDYLKFQKKKQNINYVK